jgi:glycosyltransferase involved in cell wall biosynthesis
MVSFSDKNPSISVVMPVYNGEKYLAEAINSILKQTFPDFEFIIIDDGSTDSSVKIISGFRDQRVLLKQFAVNRGNYPCRNLGMEMARGKYICVMDADDISEPERLRTQYEYMEINRDTGICGSFARNIPSNSLIIFPVDPDQLKVEFLSDNFCSHPTLFLRKEFLDDFNLKYNENYLYSSDFDLCARAFGYFKVQNLPDVLLRYRRHSGQISSTRFIEQTRYADMIRINHLMEVLGFKIEEIPVLLHLRIMKKEKMQKYCKQQAENWIHKILEMNKKVGYFDQKLLEHYLLSCLIYS